MNKLYFANIVFFVSALFFSVSMPCDARMEVLEDCAMEKVAARDGISDISVHIPGIEIKMDTYRKEKTVIAADDTGNMIYNAMLIAGADTRADTRADTGADIGKNNSINAALTNAALMDIAFGANGAGFLYSPYSYASQIVSNLSIGSIPGLTMLYGGFMPGTMLGPNLIRNLSIGLTPAGTSFGSIMTQAFTQCFTHSITGVSATMTPISGHTISGHTTTRSYNR